MKANSSALNGAITMDKPAKSYSSYTLNKCLVGYGIINGIINALIFYAMHASDMSARFDVSSLLIDGALTGFLLGAILAACALPMTKSDIKKHVLDIDSAPDGCGRLLPKNRLLAYVAIGAVCLVVMVVFYALFALVLGLPIKASQMLVVKGICCAIAGAAAGLLSIRKAIADVK